MCFRMVIIYWEWKGHMDFYQSNDCEDLGMDPVAMHFSGRCKLEGRKWLQVECEGSQEGQL